MEKQIEVERLTFKERELLLSIINRDAPGEHVIDDDDLKDIGIVTIKI